MNESEQIFSDEVLQAVDSGNKVQAIRLLREQTGLGLKDAKHAIDAPRSKHIRAAVASQLHRL